MRLDFTALEAIRRKQPLVHCISNLVSANDCANLALALGASPMMAQAPQEMAEIAARSDSAVLNTGTPDEEKFRACGLCGAEMARRGRPVVLDPVGVGASPWRLERVEALLGTCRPAVLRVNLGEALALLRRGGHERGVDCSGTGERELRKDCALALARERECAVLLSGETDVIAGSGGAVFAVAGGCGEMTGVTGTGCMLSVLCGVFAAVVERPLEAALLASGFWKACGERARETSRGPGSFRTALLDAAGTLTAAELDAEAVEL